MNARRTLPLVAGLYYELTLNPAGPVFSVTGPLNPFAVPRVREALNWLVDREHIVQEIYGGLDEGQLALYWDATAAAWRGAAETCVPAAPYTRSPEESLLAAPSCHLSRFALLGPVRAFFRPLVRR